MKGQYTDGIKGISIETFGLGEGGVRSSMLNTVEPEKRYEASIKARTDVEGYIFNLEFWDENFAYLGGNSTVISGDAWTEYKVRAQAPQGSAFMSISLSCRQDTHGKAYIDEASIVPVVKDIGSNTQLLIDDYIIESSSNITRTFHKAQKIPGVIKAEYPWEGGKPYLYGSVLYDEEEQIYKMWYQVTGYRVCYATSADGINWNKPLNLGVYKYGGSTDNNVVGISGKLDAEDNGCMPSPTVIKDMKEPDPNKRYKMIAFNGISTLAEGCYVLYTSPDGILWDYQGEIMYGLDVVTVAYDEVNSQYIAMFKNPVNSKRTHSMAVSNDLINWNEPVRMFSVATPLDSLGVLRADSYGAGLYPLGDSYVGFDWRFLITQGTMYGINDVMLMFSRDLTEDWQRPFAEPIIPLGEVGEFDSHLIYTASYPIRVGNETWLYYGGWNGDHGTSNRSSEIGIAKWRLNGFASLDCGSEEGVITTSFLIFNGSTLHVNAKVESGGYIKVELLDENDNVIQGFEKDSCTAIEGDQVDHIVRWGGKINLINLEGQTIKIRFYCKNSELYSFEFKEMQYIPDTVAVETDKEALTEELIRGNNANLDNVTEDLNLITSIPGGAGCTISWTSSNEAVIAPDGKVTRLESGDEVVTLTATITKGSASDTKEFTINVKQKEKDYILEIGDENTGGAGYIRTITIRGTKADDLTGKYLVVQFTEGTGVNANVTLIMMSALSREATVSYQVEGTRVEAWLASGMPDLLGEDMGVTVYAYVSTN